MRTIPPGCRGRDASRASCSSRAGTASSALTPKRSSGWRCQARSWPRNAAARAPSRDEGETKAHDKCACGRPARIRLLDAHALRHAFDEIPPVPPAVQRIGLVHAEDAVAVPVAPKRHLNAVRHAPVKRELQLHPTRIFVARPERQIGRDLGIGIGRYRLRRYDNCLGAHLHDNGRNRTYGAECPFPRHCHPSGY